MEHSSSEGSSKSVSENEQIELVFLKFGLAETDQQLEVIVDKYLPLILSKLSSQDENIRTKVIQLLTHISNRLKSRSEVKLPILKLLELYKDDSSAFIVNFSIIYIKLGFTRLTVKEQSDLAPQLFSATEGKPKAHQDALLRLLIATFPHVTLPDNVDERKKIFKFREAPALTKRLLEFCMDVILMPYSASLTTAQPSSRPSTAPAGGETSSSVNVPPGLSPYSVQRLGGDSAGSAWSVPQIEQIKVGILNLIGGDLFAEDDIISHLIVASSDTRHTVSTNADLELKKRQRSLDWNNATLVSQLFRLYLGDPQAAGKNAKLNPAMRRKPVSLRVKLKIIQNLLRSQTATERFPSTVQLVYDTLFAEGTSTRLRTLGLEFVHHVCDRSELSKLLPQAPLLLSAMLKATQGFEGEPRTRGLAYTAMGKLSHRVPKLFSSNLQLVQDAFQALSQENAQELKLYIQEALAMMSKAYSTVPEETMPLVEGVIAKYISDNDHLCRLSAVRYAGVVFASDHVSSRYLLLLAASDVKEDVAAEATKLLYGSDSEGLRNVEKSNQKKDGAKRPRFADMLNFVYEKAEKRLKSSKRHLVGMQSIAFAPPTFLVLIKYLRKCLVVDATQDCSDPDSGKPEPETPLIADYFDKQMLESKDVTMSLISKYTQLLMQYLRAVSDPDAAYILLEMFCVCPDQVPVKYLLMGSSEPQDEPRLEEYKNNVKSKITWMKGMTEHTKESIREYGSELYSAILKRLPASEVNQEEIVSEHLRNAKSDKSFEKKHGSILNLGYLLADWLQSSDQEMVPQYFKDALLCLVEHVTVRDTMIAHAACFALGEIIRKTALPLQDGKVKDPETQPEKNDKEKMIVTKDVTKRDVMSILLDNVKSSTAHKIRERCVITLGYFPVGDDSFPHTEHLLKALLESSEIKEADFHFTVGEALCNAALGPKSSAKSGKWRRKKSPQQETFRQDKVSWLLERVLGTYVQHRIPAVRQASCIWLLTMLKTDEFAQHPDVQPALPNIQNAFMSFLAETEDLVQDVASKGLGVVYELGTEEQKKQLVDGLVGSLLGSTSSQAPKPNQENLFHGVKIGKAPDGSNISTYKEICSLASDLNQPDLVYKFLHLAKHHALWNSKKGAAFGFSNIANLASEQLAPHLPRIVPRLYRYTFDPQPGVRNAMTSIWNALAPDPKKLVDQYLGPVTEDLKKNLASSLWRTRQASCLAVADLLRGGRGMMGGEESDIIISALPDLWTATLRVMDDIKESVRDAATVASKVLKKITIKLCDHGQGKQGEKAIASILPCLMKEGLSSRVKEVKSLSLSTLVEVSKKSGKLIRGCIPEMVVALLEALSEFEPAVLNYMAVRSDKEGREALDLARAAAAKSSPMVETIDRCLQHADKETLKMVIPSLTDLASKNVGVMTKAGCSHVFISLVSTSPSDLTPFASSIINSLFSGLTDSSLAIRKCNSDAVGHVVRVAKDSNVVKVFTRLRGWYLEKEDEIHHHAAAAACHAIGKHSPDVLRAHATVALPLAFLGMHESQNDKNGKLVDQNASKKEDKNSSYFLWNDLWTEFTPGTASAIKLYLDELIDCTSVALGSSQWKRKAQAAATMATIARQQREGTIAGAQLRKLLEILLAGLQGRTWDGKDQLLTALCAVAVHCKSELTLEEVSSVLSVLFKECKREKLVYKTEAIHCLGSVLEAHKIDKFTHFWEIVHPIIRKDSDKGSDSEDDNEDKGKSNSPKMVLLDKSIHACGKAWPADRNSQAQHFVEVVKLLSGHITLSTWNIQLTSLQAMKKILRCILASVTVKNEGSSMEVDTSDQRPKLDLEQTNLVEAVCVSLGNVKYSRIREEGLALSQLLHDLTKAEVFEPTSTAKLVEALRTSPLAERKSNKRTQVEDLIKKISGEEKSS